MFTKHLSRLYHRRRYVILGLLLFSAIHLVFQPMVAGQSTPEERVADTPEAWIESLFSEAPDGITTESLFIATANDHAVIPYTWGEGGGFVVLAKDDDGWVSICGSGGAIDGGDFFAEFCGMSLIDAQALWEAYRIEYNAIYGDEL